MKKYFLISLIILATALFVRPAQAKETVELFYFYEDSCPSCQSMSDTLVGLKNKYGIVLATFDVSSDTSNRAIFEDLLTLSQTPSRQTPTVFIGTEVYVGYSAAITSEIEKTIIQCQATKCVSPQETLDQYYEFLAHPEKNDGILQQKSTLFWILFMIIWPLLGVAAIIIVLKKYRKK